MEYSVLMSVYKSDNPVFFEAALKSMINQTRKADEIVIVKDGPITNELQEVIDKCKKDANIVDIQINKNVGLGLALNEGLKVCKNELIARMDADDISSLNRCYVQVKEFELNPKLDIVGLSVIEFVGKIDEVIGYRTVPLTNEEIYKYARIRDPFNHPTVMYRKSSVVDVGMYSDYRKNQDTDLWIKLLMKNAICKNINGDLFYFRFDENTYKKRKSWINTKLLIDIRYKAYRNKFCSLKDFLFIFVAQITIFLVPVFFQKIIYRKILR